MPTDLDSLRIIMHLEACPLLDKINEWIRYGMQRVVGGFRLRILFTEQNPGMMIRPPSSCPAMAGGDEEGRALGDFLSSCCPGLRRLEIKRPRGLTQLVLRVEALEELHVFLAGLQALDVTAPNLLVLKLEATVRVRIARIIAPRLQEGISQAKCFCDVLGKWTDQGQISMEFLEDVKINGFTGGSKEMALVSLLFKSSRSIKSMSLRAAASKISHAISLKQMMGDEDEDEVVVDDDDDPLEPIHLKLMDMFSTDRGHWQFDGKSVYTWVPYTT
ncbi:hypothetical protein BAE44_0023835 [Dichanthelium oligosanthes]|uniref:FBD domain-containing protein n=1 Tax=Dichanthelium oligosanthes TaxID=888268 RepID=A0A1E5UQJ7_9POAL|nr:hypothetical protein BAE44_0023835 [Dichanthelium oligosanthes]